MSHENVRIGLWLLMVLLCPLAMILITEVYPFNYYAFGVSLWQQVAIRWLFFLHFPILAICGLWGVNLFRTIPSRVGMILFLLFMALFGVLAAKWNWYL